MSTLVVVPWHRKEQIELFCSAWKVSLTDSRIIFKQDRFKEGCAKTKNAGIRQAKEEGADVVIVLDDDCFPLLDQSLESFISQHEEALKPQQVKMFEEVTSPPSRGTPYFCKSIELPVAASMGFWAGVGDYDAVSQLVYGATHKMIFKQHAIYGRYFPLCGMNLAFRVDQWPWCQFIDIPRFDDIWQGFIWQKHAYSSGQCFNLNGPVVTHSRQSNVWQNLKDETVNLERNETIWLQVHQSTAKEHADYLKELNLRV